MKTRLWFSKSGGEESPETLVLIPVDIDKDIPVKGDNYFA
jgi:hypothetical protein